MPSGADAGGTGRAGFAGSEVAALAAVIAWALLPFALLLPGSDGVFNGSTGIAVADDMQYLSWVRDAGGSVLFSSYFDVVPDPHLFFHPMAALSGLLWKLGASVQLAYLAWKPLAAVLLLVGFAAYVYRMLGEDRTARLAALILALFFFTPATPVIRLLGVDDPELLFGTDILGLEAFPVGYLWGGLFASVSIALMPLFLLGVERVLEPGRRDSRRSLRWYAGWTGLAGMLASWMHPWQGMTLLVIVAGLVVWGKLARRYLVLALPVVLTAAPLVYFYVLSHTDSSWGFASAERDYSHFGLWFVLAIAPALLAFPGFRGPTDDVQERLIRLWPVAALAVYFGLDQSWFYHAFSGVSLPLAILGVRGWKRMRVPRLVGATALVILTLPGVAYAVDKLVDTKREHFFTSDEKRALDYVESSPRRGAVLAPYEPLGYAVPAFAGRRTWIGHYNWTPQAAERNGRTEALFDGQLDRRESRRLVIDSRAVFLISDCRGRADLSTVLGPLIVRSRRLGCATVYEIRP